MAAAAAVGAGRATAVAGDRQQLAESAAPHPTGGAHLSSVVGAGAVAIPIAVS